MQSGVTWFSVHAAMLLKPKLHPFIYCLLFFKKHTVSHFALIVYKASPTPAAQNSNSVTATSASEPRTPAPAPLIIAPVLVLQCPIDFISNWKTKFHEWWSVGLDVQNTTTSHLIWFNVHVAVLFSPVASLWVPSIFIFIFIVLGFFYFYFILFFWGCILDLTLFRHSRYVTPFWAYGNLSDQKFTKNKNRKRGRNIERIKKKRKRKKEKQDFLFKKEKKEQYLYCTLLLPTPSPPPTLPIY